MPVSDVVVNALLPSSHEWRSILPRVNSSGHDQRAQHDFSYSPLTGVLHIRLVRIHRGNAKDIISVSLRTIDLDDKHDFTALSYTWRKQRTAYQLGLDIAKESLTRSWKQKKFQFAVPDGKPVVELSEPILCNGKNVLVSPALWEVLSTFREKGSTREYWIDGICINQSDSEEKTSQVKLMGRIYTASRLVLVWLGSYSKWHEGIPGLEKMAQCLTDEQLPPYFFDNEDKEGDMLRKETADSLGLSRNDCEPLEREATLALVLTQRLWFTRIWVLQEYLLARQVVFYYAGQQISKEAIRKAFIWVYTNTGARKLSAQNPEMSSLLGALANIWSSHALDFPFLFTARETILQGRKLTLEEWIRVCRGRQAGDPRDFVFGGLSLLRKDCVGIHQDVLQLEHLADSTKRPPALPPRPSGSGTNTTKAVLHSAKEPTTLLPSGLWAKLEPQYKATDAEVFINLAACMLSHGRNRVSRLLSLAARPIDDEFLGEDGSWLQPNSSTSDGGIPSWAPVLGSWSARMNSDLMSARIEAGGGAATFAAATSDGIYNAHPPPQISRDGRTLLLNVIPLDTVKREGKTKSDDNIHSFRERSNIILFLEFLLELPDGAYKEGRTSFDAVATSLATCLPPDLEDFGIDETTIPTGDKETMSTDARPTLEDCPRLWLCELLDREVRHWVSFVQWEISVTKESREKEASAIWLSRLKSLYLQLITRYDHLPWSGTADGGLDALTPGSLLEPEKSDPQSSDMDGRQFDESTIGGRLAKRLAQKLENLGVGMENTVIARNDWQRRQPVSSGARQYQEALEREVVFFRKLFVTRDGLVGFGPAWLKSNDRVMLVQGAPVPYIFRHVSEVDLHGIIRQAMASLDVLGKRIGESQLEDVAKAGKKNQSEVKDSQTTWYLKRKARGLRAKIAEHELQIGRDVWFLVGEAYVEGIMHGEAMERIGVGAFEGISVV